MSSKNKKNFIKKYQPDTSFYDRELAKTIVNPKFLGGAVVFPDTMLSVFKIGSMLAMGETKSNILANYPYLTSDNLRFAKMYYYNELNRPVIDTKQTLDKLFEVAKKEKNDGKK